MEIFNHTYYPPELTDWYMDDWISRTYGNKRTRQVRSVELRHHTTSQTVRYYVDFYRKEYLEGLVREGRDQIAEYMRAHNETSAAVKAFLSSRFDNATVAQVE